jgi:hypothetical protein
VTLRDLKVWIGRCAACTGPVAVALGLLIAVPGTLAIGPMRARHAPIISSDQRPFVPTVGDWEGTVEGYPASFQLIYEPANFALHLPPYGFEDLATLTPSSCPLAANKYVEAVIAESELTPLGPGGSFPLASDGIAGGVHGPKSATLSRQFDTGAGVRANGCRGTLTWAMHPANRQSVRDGSWTLRFADGESEPFTVSAGGRLAEGIAFPAAVAHCGGPFGDINLFIAPSGTATMREPGGLFAASLSFTGANASGRFTASKRCGAFHLAMTASLMKPASG